MKNLSRLHFVNCIFQDVTHILARTFRDLFTRDDVESEIVRNLNKSKSGEDTYHDKYVEELRKVCTLQNKKQILEYIKWFSTLLDKHHDYEINADFFLYTSF